jgi:hypothetical protein
MLKFDPNSRITACEALSHEYFANLTAQGYLDDYHGLEFQVNKPMNVDLEKIAESPGHLRDNVSETL